jgi:hypothetical protein
MGIHQLVRGGGVGGLFEVLTTQNRNSLLSYWTELQHRDSLRGGADIEKQLVTCSVSQLMPSFVVLIVGTVLSSVVFIAELILNSLCKSRDRKDSCIRRARKLY